MLKRLLLIHLLLLSIGGSALRGPEMIMNVTDFDFDSDGFAVGRKKRIDVVYDFGKTAVRPESYPLLDSVYVFLECYPTLVVEVVNHIDSRGNDKYNLKLSEVRAKCVADYLIAKGISPDQISSRGAGETELIYKDDFINSSNFSPGEKEVYHQINRRTELVIKSINYQNSDKVSTVIPKEDFRILDTTTLHLFFGKEAASFGVSKFARGVLTYSFHNQILSANHPYKKNKKIFMPYLIGKKEYHALVMVSTQPDTEPQILGKKEDREIYQYGAKENKWMKLDW